MGLYSAPFPITQKSSYLPLFLRAATNMVPPAAWYPLKQPPVGYLAMYLPSPGRPVLGILEQKRYPPLRLPLVR